MVDKKTLREHLKKRVRKMYDENFELEGVWGQYILHPDQTDDKSFSDYVLHEVWHNGQFHTKQHYVRWVLKEMKKNKTLQDWEAFAKRFVKGFDEEGNVKLVKK